MNKYTLYLDAYFFLLLFILTWVLYGGNVWNGDRDAYELYYARDNIASWGVEILYGYINIFFSKSGMSYQVFQMVVSFSTLLIVSFYLKRVSAYVGVSYLLFSILMFPLDYVLMRVSLSYAIVLNAFICLYYERKISYVFLIFTAALIHQSALIFLVFLLVGDSANKKSILNYVFYSLLLIVAAQLFFNYGSIFSVMAEHVLYYEVTWKSIVSSIFFHLLSTLLMLLNFKSKLHKKKYDYFILNLNIVSVLLFPLYFQANIFVRLFRLIVFVNLIYNIQSIFTGKKIEFYGLLYVLFYSIYLILYYILPTLEYSLYPMFESNLLVSILVN